MKIQAVTKYVFKDKEYKSLMEVKDAVHDTIGEEVLDIINKKIEIRHKDLLPLLEILCSRKVREVLMECYSVTYESVTHNYEEGEFEVDTKNILDLNN